MNRCTYITSSLKPCDSPVRAYGDVPYCRVHSRLLQSHTKWAAKQDERKTLIQSKESLMSERTVIVNGVQLTRSQVEQAMKDLNAPHFVTGDIVKFEVAGGGVTRGVVVLEGSIHSMLRDRHGAPSNGYLRVTDGCESWTLPASSFTKVGSFNDR